MEKKEKKIIVILFVVCLLIGLVAVQGYGINVDENPEIAAQMIKNWLKGDDDNG